jgi:hypothetical protein
MFIGLTRCRALPSRCRAQGWDCPNLLQDRAAVGDEPFLGERAVFDAVDPDAVELDRLAGGLEGALRGAALHEPHRDLVLGCDRVEDRRLHVMKGGEEGGNRRLEPSKTVHITGCPRVGAAVPDVVGHAELIEERQIGVVDSLVEEAADQLFGIVHRPFLLPGYTRQLLKPIVHVYHHLGLREKR